jgi:hypothetical protein
MKIISDCETINFLVFWTHPKNHIFLFHLNSLSYFKVPVSIQIEIHYNFSCYQIGVTRAGARKFLVSTKKEFKDEHRGDLARAGLLMQSRVKPKQKCTKGESGQAQEGVLCWRFQDLKVLLGSMHMFSLGKQG